MNRPGRPPPSTVRSGDRLLFVTLSNIGDAVLTTPTLAAMHEQFPEAAIDIVARKRTAELFAHCPYRGDLIIKPRTRTLGAYLAYVGALRARRYRLVVDLRSPVVPWLLRARTRRGKWRRDDAARHAVRDHLRVLDGMFRPAAAIPPTRVWWGPDADARAAELLAPVAGRPLVAFGPGANYALKIWPAARFAALAAALAEAGGDDALVLLGDRQDRASCGEVAAGSGMPTVDVAGETGLLAAAAVLARCRVFVGNDSGLGHLASAVGTPTLTLFGPGQPERYRPWGDRARIIEAPAGDLARLEVAPVAEALTALLAPPASVAAAS